MPTCIRDFVLSLRPLNSQAKTIISTRSTFLSSIEENFPNFLSIFFRDILVGILTDFKDYVFYLKSVFFSKMWLVMSGQGRMQSGRGKIVRLYKLTCQKFSFAMTSGMLTPYLTLVV